MLETISYTAGWSTAPKPVPTQATYSGDTGDYGTPYYWYDEDGDVYYEEDEYEDGEAAEAEETAEAVDTEAADETAEEVTEESNE